MNLNTLFILFIILWILQKIYNYNHIYFYLLIIILIYNINDLIFLKNKYINEDYNIINDAKNKMNELKSKVKIKGISTLFKNAQLLDFIYDIKNYTEVNNLNYSLLIKQIIKYIKNMNDNETKKDILNTFHTFVYSIGADKLKEFNSYFNKLQELLKYKDADNVYQNGNNTDYFG